MAIYFLFGPIRLRYFAISRGKCSDSMTILAAVESSPPKFLSFKSGDFCVVSCKYHSWADLEVSKGGFKVDHQGQS